MPAGLRPARVVAGAAVLALLAAMALDTTVIKVGSENDVRSAGFSPEQFARREFPKVKESIESRAVPALTLAAAIEADKAAAGQEYGVPASIGPIFPVSFTGVVGEGSSGIHTVAVEGLPDDLVIRVQTGPAINGTALRDSTGSYNFGDFTNQIEYQNAGAALNEEMKREVLSQVDISDLTGEMASVTGVFQLINPQNWLVTPVGLEVQ